MTRSYTVTSADITRGNIIGKVGAVMEVRRNIFVVSSPQNYNLAGSKATLVTSMNLYYTGNVALGQLNSPSYGTVNIINSSKSVVTATNIVVTLPIPQGVTITDPGSSGAIVGNNLVITRPSLAPRDSYQAAFTFNTSGSAGTSYDFIGTVTSDTANSVPGAEFIHSSLIPIP